MRLIRVSQKTDYMIGTSEPTSCPSHNTRARPGIVISAFIIASTIMFIALGNPVKLLVLAGMVNGLILPVALAVILIAATKSSIVHQYRHPMILQFIGWVVVAMMSYLGYLTILKSLKSL